MIPGLSKLAETDQWPDFMRKLRTRTLKGVWVQSFVGNGLRKAACKKIDLMIIEQNPMKGSKWAQLAREGHEVWQVFVQGNYAGVIVDERLEVYGRNHHL